MARIPEGADLIVNTVSAAPGFRIGNVHVMAGVPMIMKAMLEAIAPTLKGGTQDALGERPLPGRRGRDRRRLRQAAGAVSRT